MKSMELQILRENNYGQKNKDERVVMLITILYFFLKNKMFLKIFLKKLFLKNCFVLFILKWEKKDMSNSLSLPHHSG